MFESLAGGAAQAASGVTVKVLGSPDLGSTTTRADGTYEIAVNGGGRVTLDYSKAGSLGAQRAATVKWKDILRVEDVQLSSHDGPTTTVTPGSATPKLALGRAIGAGEDSAGARQAAIYVPSGTTSSNLAAASWSVNLTEYTVGANGPRRMPGPLPLTSGYTYAFAASIAEATGVGRVEFNQPLYFYVENFAGFPVGADAPMGSYDRARGEWVPEKSGRVVKVLSVRAPAGGGANIVDLDIDGGTTSETDADLLSILGITTQEREVLATRYSPGKTLWRVPVSRFSDWDVNWGIVPPDDAQVPDVEEPNPSIVPDPKCKKHHASTIHCETQYLSEDVAVAGTPYRLHYTTERTPGRKATLRIPLVSAAGFTGTPPIRVDWRVSVAGRTFEGSAPPNPGQYVDFVFDGLDAFGRVVQGGHPYAVDIYNVYPARYASTSRFGYRSNGSFAISTARTTFTFHTRREGVLDNFDARGLGLRGWTISPHHVLDLDAKVLWLGTGERQAGARGSSVIDTLAARGSGPWLYPGQRVNAVGGLQYGFTPQLSAMPDGSVLANMGDTNFGTTQIVRLWSDRTATLEVDQASGPLERRAEGVTATPDGTVYVPDRWNARLWRVRNGLPSVIMGMTTGASGTCAPSDTCVGEGPALTLGSVRLVVNASTGVVLQRLTYDAWGSVKSDSNSGAQPFGFAGGLYDPDTKLAHFGAREYDPELGRWLSKDEARWGGGLNFYAYAANDPVDLVDTSGRTPGAAALPGPWGPAAAPAAAGATGVASKSAGQVIVEVAFFGGLFWLVGEQVFATAPPDDEGEREGGVDGLSPADAADAGTDACSTKEEEQYPVTGASPGAPPECHYTCASGETFTVYMFDHANHVGCWPAAPRSMAGTFFPLL